MADWIQKATKEMDKKGTIGAFTKQAKRAKMSTDAFADKVLSNPSKFHEKTRKRAQFYKNMQKKYAKGGGLDSLEDRIKENYADAYVEHNIEVDRVGENEYIIYADKLLEQNDEDGRYNGYNSKGESLLYEINEDYFGSSGKMLDWGDRVYLRGVVLSKKKMAKGGTLSRDEFRDGIGNTAFQLVEEGGGSAKLGEYVEEGIQNYVDKFYAKGGGVKISNYTATKETEDFYEMDSYVKGFYNVYNENDLFLESKEVDGIYPINVDGKRLMDKGEGYVIKKGKKYMFMQPIYEEMAKGGKLHKSYYPKRYVRNFDIPYGQEGHYRETTDFIEEDFKDDYLEWYSIVRNDEKIVRQAENMRVFRNREASLDDTQYLAQQILRRHIIPHSPKLEDEDYTTHLSFKLASDLIKNHHKSYMNVTEGEYEYAVDTGNESNIETHYYAKGGELYSAGLATEDVTKEHLGYDDKEWDELTYDEKVLARRTAHQDYIRGRKSRLERIRAEEESKYFTGYLSFLNY